MTSVSLIPAVCIICCQLQLRLLTSVITRSDKILRICNQYWQFRHFSIAIFKVASSWVFYQSLMTRNCQQFQVTAKLWIWIGVCIPTPFNQSWGNVIQDCPCFALPCQIARLTTPAHSKTTNLTSQKFWDPRPNQFFRDQQEIWLTQWTYALPCKMSPWLVYPVAMLCQSNVTEFAMLCHLGEIWQVKINLSWHILPRLVHLLTPIV